jgi:hypothetical protein
MTSLFKPQTFIVTLCYNKEKYPILVISFTVMI